MKDPKAPSSSQSKDSNKEVSRFHECCPLKLKSFPKGICQMGLSRARWTADNPGYLAFEEKRAAGCPFGMLTEDKHSYCFFKKMADIEQPLSEEEIMKLLCLTKDQVRKIIDSSFHKLRGQGLIQELHQLHKDGGLFTEHGVEEDSDIYFPDHFSADSVQADGMVEDLSDNPTNKK